MGYSAPLSEPGSQCCLPGRVQAVHDADYRDREDVTITAAPSPMHTSIWMIRTIMRAMSCPLLFT